MHWILLLASEMKLVTLSVLSSLKILTSSAENCLERLAQCPTLMAPPLYSSLVSYVGREHNGRVLGRTNLGVSLCIGTYFPQSEAAWTLQ